MSPACHRLTCHCHDKDFPKIYLSVCSSAYCLLLFIHLFICLTLLMLNSHIPLFCIGQWLYSLCVNKVLRHVFPLFTAVFPILQYMECYIHSEYTYWILSVCVTLTNMFFCFFFITEVCFCYCVLVDKWMCNCYLILMMYYCLFMSLCLLENVCFYFSTSTCLCVLHPPGSLANSEWPFGWFCPIGNWLRVRQEEGGA